MRTLVLGISLVYTCILDWLLHVERRVTVNKRIAGLDIQSVNDLFQSTTPAFRKGDDKIPITC